MTASGTHYFVRDADPHRVLQPGEVPLFGSPRDGIGLEDARRWAITNSTAGREVVIVEVINGAETGEAGRFSELDECCVFLGRAGRGGQCLELA